MIDDIFDKGNLYKTTFDTGTSFVWRLLTLREYGVLKSLRDTGTPNLIVCEMAFRRCYVGEYEYINKNLPIGQIISVGGLIMYMSGDCPPESLITDLEMIRTNLTSNPLNLYMLSVIFTAFPSYKEEDIYNMSRIDFLKKFALSEEILAKRIPNYERLSFAAPKEESELDIKKENEELRKAGGGMSIMDRIQLNREQAAALDKR